MSIEKLDSRRTLMRCLRGTIMVDWKITRETNRMITKDWIYIHTSQHEGNIIVEEQQNMSVLLDYNPARSKKLHSDHKIYVHECYALTLSTEVTIVQWKKSSLTHTRDKEAVRSPAPHVEIQRPDTIKPIRLFSQDPRRDATSNPTTPQALSLGSTWTVDCH